MDSLTWSQFISFVLLPSLAAITMALSGFVLRYINHLSSKLDEQDAELKRNSEKTEKTYSLVNGEREKLLNRIQALILVLQAKDDQLNFLLSYPEIQKINEQYRDKRRIKLPDDDEAIRETVRSYLGEDS